MHASPARLHRPHAGTHGPPCCRDGWVCASLRSNVMSNLVHRLHFFYRTDQDGSEPFPDELEHISHQVGAAASSACSRRA